VTEAGDCYTTEFAAVSPTDLVYDSIEFLHYQVNLSSSTHEVEGTIHRWSRQILHIGHRLATKQRAFHQS
jgi:hypothetical protein